MTEIKYFTKNINLTDQVKRPIEEKIKKFSHLATNLLEVDIDLSYSPTHQKTMATRLEIVLEMPGKKIIASARASDVQEAADLVEKKIKKQLERNKELVGVKRKITRIIVRDNKSI